jgi:hypothetical protein
MEEEMDEERRYPDPLALSEPRRNTSKRIFEAPGKRK